MKLTIYFFRAETIDLNKRVVGVSYIAVSIGGRHQRGMIVKNELALGNGADYTHYRNL